MPSALNANEIYSSNMKNINIEEISNRLETFAKERDWNQFHSVKNLSMALNVESSELLEIFQWMTEEDSNKITSDEKKLGQVKEEMADIFLYLVRIASKLNIDLEAVALDKIETNAKKYPVEKAKGNAKKYTEL